MKNCFPLLIACLIAKTLAFGGSSPEHSGKMSKQPRMRGTLKLGEVTYADLWVGTPPVLIASNITFDTGAGSANLADKSMPGCSILPYSSGASSTAVPLGRPYTQPYGEGSMIGSFYNETISFGEGLSATVTIGLGEPSGFGYCYNGNIGMNPKSFFMASFMQQHPDVPKIVAISGPTIQVPGEGFFDVGRIDDQSYVGEIFCVPMMTPKQKVEFKEEFNMDMEWFGFKFDYVELNGVRSAPGNGIMDTGATGIYGDFEHLFGDDSIGGCVNDLKVSINGQILALANTADDLCSMHTKLTKNPRGGFGMDIILGTMFYEKYFVIHDYTSGNNRLGVAVKPQFESKVPLLNGSCVWP